MIFIRSILLFIFFVSTCRTQLVAQEGHPHITNYSKEDYHAGRQNWDIDIDSHGIVYFGNSEGLLYNIHGEWGFETMTQAGDIRSVYVRNDTIWCGGDEFGYFVKSEEAYDFYSLGKAGAIWNIESLNEQIYFQSENKIIIYDIKEKKITSKFYSRIGATVKWNDKIWSIFNNGQLGYLNGVEFVLVEEIQEFVKREVRKMFVQNDRLYFILLDGEVYYYDGENIIKEAIPSKAQNNSLFTGIGGENNRLFLGTVSSGFLQVDRDKGAVKEINKQKGLLDNTVLSLKLDEAGNIWLGLDYGIAKVELESPIRTIFEGAAVLDRITYEETSYLATNKGLFVSKQNQPFELVQNSEGQVWKLKEIEGKLFVCHNRGLLRVNNNSLEVIEDFSGFIDISHFAGTKYYLITTYDGLFLARKDGNKIKALKNTKLWGHSKLIYDAENECIWAEMRKNRVFKLQLDESEKLEHELFSNINNISNTSKGLLFNVDGKIQKYVDGAFQEANNPLLQDISGDDAKALHFDETGKKLAYIQNGEVKLKLSLADGNIYAFDSFLKKLSKDIIKSSDFLQIENNLLYIATDRGLKTFNFEYVSKNNLANQPIISSLKLLNDTEKRYYYPFPSEGLQFSKGEKNIELSFDRDQSVYDLIEYRYRLEPIEDTWSPWYADRHETLYSQVGGGDYTFRLQSRRNGVQLEKENSLKFSIDKLWYESSWIIFPILLGIASWIFGVIIIMSRINQRKLKTQEAHFRQRSLEESISVKNELLLQYVETISQKNEFLNKIKLSLKEIDHPKTRRWVNMITSEINSEKKDFLFHKLFSNVHQDFINRIAQSYPSLTANDIRMLSYIRINLNKKEIANLVNISIKSVEMSKYRIKKKMNLDKDTSLGKFIREF